MQTINPRSARLAKCLNQSSEHLLSIYLTAGYPELHDTATICAALAQAGVDLIEVGFPHSDPIADGPTIQRSSKIALQNGMTMDLYFSAISEMREYLDVPLLFMGYFNNVLSYGVERFCETCQLTGIDGAIIPDLPPEEYLSHYEEIFSRAALDNIFLVTPDTPDERIRYLDRYSTAFLYAVSGRRTTGVTGAMDDSTLCYLERMSSMNLRHPLLVGFGISNREDIIKVEPVTRGVIVGSAFIDQLRERDNIKHLGDFISNLRRRSSQ